MIALIAAIFGGPSAFWVVPLVISAAVVGLLVSAVRARIWWWPEVAVIREPIVRAVASLAAWTRANVQRVDDAIHGGMNDPSSTTSVRHSLVRKVAFVSAVVVLVETSVLPRVAPLAPSQPPSPRFGAALDRVATAPEITCALFVAASLAALIVWSLRPVLETFDGRRSRRATGFAALEATTLAAVLTSLTLIRPSIDRSIGWLPAVFDAATHDVPAIAGPMPLYVSWGPSPLREVGMDDGGHGGMEWYGRSRAELDRNDAFRYVGDHATVHDIGHGVGFACLGAECALGRAFVVRCADIPEAACDDDPADDFAVVAGPGLTFRRGARLVGRAAPSGSVVEVDGRTYTTQLGLGSGDAPSWWNPAPTRASRTLAWAAAVALALAAIGGVRTSTREAIVYGLLGAAYGVREAFPGSAVVVAVVLVSARWLIPAACRFVARRPDPT